jgi:hypothetical protein
LDRPQKGGYRVRFGGRRHHPDRLTRSKALSERMVGIETTDKLTDPQIVAKVKEHYGLDR